MSNNANNIQVTKLYQLKHKDKIEYIVISNDGQFIATASAQELKIWRVNDKSPKLSQVDDFLGVKLIFQDSCHYLVVVKLKNRIFQINIIHLENFSQQEFNLEEFSCIFEYFFVAENIILLSENLISIFNITQKKIIRKKQIKLEKCLFASINEKILIICDRNKVIRFYEIQSLQLIYTIYQNSWVLQISHLNYKNPYLFIYECHFLFHKIYNFQSKKLIRKTQIEMGGRLSNYSNNNLTMLYTSVELYFYDIENGQCVYQGPQILNNRIRNSEIRYIQNLKYITYQFGQRAQIFSINN